jgi:hypothetical protein
MKWRGGVLQFALRVGLWLVVLGSLYLLYHSLHHRTQHTSQAASQQLAAVRASLDETYIAGSSLHAFKRTDVQAYLALNDLYQRYRQSGDSLNKQLQVHPKLLSEAHAQQLQTIVSRQQQTRQAFEARFKILSQIIQYDPGHDLQGSADSQAAILAGRARAAQRGLNKAADDQTASSSASSLNVDNENGPTLLVSAPLKASLQQEANCFGLLAQQLDAHNAAAGATRTQCLSAYPAVRAQAIQAIITPVFDDSYQTFMQSRVPQLLKQLDATIKAQL